MKQHAHPTGTVEANCACIGPSPVQSLHQPPAIQPCSTPMSLPNHGNVSPMPASREGHSSRSKFVASWQGRRIDDATAAKQPASTTLQKKLCLQFPTMALPKGHVLFRQGEPANAVFYIATGLVHRVVGSANGNERLLAILGPDDFCGEECLTAQSWHSTSAIAMEAAQIIRIEKAAILRLLRDSPAFSDVFTAFLLSRKLKTEAALIDQLVGSVEQRLKRALLALARTSQGGSNLGIVPNAKQEMLAALVGTTRPRINHFLTKFRKLGLIDYGRGMPAGEIRLGAALQQVDERDDP
ncbi:MAG: Crp/Fnr family transcriptional regulator [Nitrospirae bacterium]|nr:MAG: Crp/Fnr family transcriptional regulator [Nitrospirota bacterium]